MLFCWTDEPMTTERMSVLPTCLACPACHSPLTVPDGHRNGSIECENCGTVGQQTGALLDFLTETPSVPTAGGGVFDLQADQRAAEELARREADLDFSSALQLAQDLTGPETAQLPPRQVRALERFDRHYRKMTAATPANVGDALFSKLQPMVDREFGSSTFSGSALLAAGGFGLYVPDFSRHFHHVVFVDCSLVCIIVSRILAREVGATNVQFVRADIHQLPFQPGSFDFVHAENVTEHVASPRRMIGECLRVTRSPGHFVCVSPNRFSLLREPHFRIPAYWFLPASIRVRLLPLVRGVSSEQGTSPISLARLRDHFAATRPSKAVIYFLPPGLTITARQTWLRRAVHFALNSRVCGGIFARIINGPLLTLAPYHIAVGIPAADPVPARRLEERAAVELDGVPGNES